MSTEVGCFQILEIPQNLIRKNRILGGVIASGSCTNPFDTYAPYWDNPRWDKDKKDFADLKATIDFFWQARSNDGNDAVKLEDVIAHRGASTEDEGKAKLTEMLTAYAKKVVNEKVELKAGEVQEYTMDNPGGAVGTRLNDCKPWREELQRLYDGDRRKKRRDFYIVTGVYTCKSMEVGWKKDKSRGAGVDAGIPGEAAAAAVTATTGVPVPSTVAKLADVKVKYVHVNETDTDVVARINQEIIFALRYHELILTFDDQKQPGFFAKIGHKLPGKSEHDVAAPKIKSVALGKPIRAVGNISSYGGPDKSAFYWVEPDYKLPDTNTEEDVGVHEAGQNGVAN